MKLQIKSISEGEEYEVQAGKNLVCSVATKQKAKAVVAAIEALESVSRDCQMALNGTWDKGDEGFAATRESVDSALNGLGVKPPVEKNNQLT